MCKICLGELASLIITIVIILIFISIVILLLYLVKQAQAENKKNAKLANTENLQGTNRDFLLDFLYENRGLRNRH